MRAFFVRWVICRCCVFFPSQRTRCGASPPVAFMDRPVILTSPYRPRSATAGSPSPLVPPAPPPVDGVAAGARRRTVTLPAPAKATLPGHRLSLPAALPSSPLLLPFELPIVPESPSSISPVLEGAPARSPSQSLLPRRRSVGLSAPPRPPLSPFTFPEDLKEAVSPAPPTAPLSPVARSSTPSSVPVSPVDKGDTASQAPTLPSSSVCIPASAFTAWPDRLAARVCDDDSHPLMAFRYAALAGFAVLTNAPLYL